MLSKAISISISISTSISISISISMSISQEIRQLPLPFLRANKVAIDLSSSSASTFFWFSSCKPSFCVRLNQPSRMSDLAIAFVVTTGSGLATMLGSLVVFIPSFYKPYILGVCLALAAGVMIYVSFIEIFFKGLNEFEVYFDEKHNLNRSSIAVADYDPPSEAYFATTATFFGGTLLTFILDRFIHHLYSRCAPDGQKPADAHDLERQEIWELKEDNNAFVYFYRALSNISIQKQKSQRLMSRGKIRIRMCCLCLNAILVMHAKIC
eukprot:m.232800 g.232800  ORF g.232800 m.232800 type:complete len:267 (-) comp17078_c1_seq5:746-1546(-)